MILAVIGKPIMHSASPDLHEAGLSKNQIKGASFRIVADGADEVANLCRQIGVSGLNITAPFKQDFARLVDNLSPEAKVLEAVNTVVFESGSTKGFNTDVVGIRNSLEKLLQSKIPQNTVVLGAGGAARAVCHVLKELNYNFTVVNRTLENAANLATEFSAHACSFSDQKHKEKISSADLIVNCLSTTESPFDLSCLHAGQSLLDAHYKTQSALAARMIELGANVMDGQDWLLWQGAAAQQIFFAQKQQAPQLEDLRAALLAARKLKDLQSVALVGLMGSGKSEAGILLASKLGMTFVDLDTEIEKVAGKKISQIFADQGEEAFRELETKTLYETLSSSEAKLISCGGGIVLRPENRAGLKKSCKIIWLWASVETLALRLEGDKNRPLLQGQDLKEKLNELLSNRKILYAEAADLVIDTDKRSPEFIAERIFSEIC